MNDSFVNQSTRQNAAQQANELIGDRRLGFLKRGAFVSMKILIDISAFVVAINDRFAVRASSRGVLRKARRISFWTELATTRPHDAAVRSTMIATWRFTPRSFYTSSAPRAAAAFLRCFILSFLRKHKNKSIFDSFPSAPFSYIPIFGKPHEIYLNRVFRADAHVIVCQRWEQTSGIKNSRNSKFPNSSNTRRP